MAINASATIKQSIVGERTSIGKDAIVIKSEIGNCCDIEKRNFLRNAKVGDMTYTGANTSIMWAEVGKYCNISRNVVIGGNEHNYLAASMFPEYRIKNALGGRISLHPDESTIIIGNDVWLGQGVSILRKENMTIGDGAVIGSGAVVTKSVPPYAIAIGIPARVVKYRFPDPVIDKLMEIRWYDWEKTQVLKYWNLLSAELDDDTVEELLNISIKLKKENTR